MHDCLHINEILVEVMGYLTTTADALNMACTCRTFREPALDKLWDTLEALSLLVQCLPDETLGRTTEYGMTTLVSSSHTV